MAKQEFPFPMPNGWFCITRSHELKKGEVKSLKFCEKERISYYPFKNFKDVIARIKPMLEQKKIKKRYQAELKRKAVYAQG